MMKNTAKVLTFSILAASASFTSCVDNDKNLFDGAKVKQIYEQTFPVKDIDPDGDWSMSRSVAAHVSVNGDAGTDYTIRIFDANPLASENDAWLLAEGIANNEKEFNVTVDCAMAIRTLFVARVDAKGHYLVQPVAIENGEVKAHFGDEEKSETRAAVLRGGVSSAVPVMSAPYTAEQISAKKEGATEVQAGWDLGAGSGWAGNYHEFDVFKQNERWFKITKKDFEGSFTTSGNSGGATAIKVIVTNGSKWIIKDNNQFSDITEIIVEDGGEIEIKNHASLILTNSSYITVMKGGVIKGDGDIRITNGSGRCKNYNAGIIDCSDFDFNGGAGEFYNYGELKLDKYSASTPGTTLINHGTIKAEDIKANNNTHIKNGCHIEVEDEFEFGTLLMGYASEAICEELSRNGNDNDITMEEQSMLVCEKADLCRHISGPTKGKALLKIDKIIGNVSELPYSTSFIKNNVICEVKDQKSNGKHEWEWSGFDWLVNQCMKGSATYCNPGKADFMLPKGDCVKKGYNSDDDDDDVELKQAVYTYAFEDNYPNAGDYDFNDIVLNVTMPVACGDDDDDDDDDADELKYKIELRAIGAVKQLGAGLRIKGIKKSNVKEVRFKESTPRRTGSLNNSAIFENTAFETNGSELVIPLFGDAHYIYGYTGNKRVMLNTGNASTPLTDIYTLELTIKLDDDIDIPSATKELDFFIAYQGMGNKRTEIHLNRFNTATANGQLANDDLLEIIKVVNNTWALCVPDKFAYPKETTVITDAYSGFAGWAHEQESNTNWFSAPVNADKVIKY